MLGVFRFYHSSHARPLFPLLLLPLPFPIHNPSTPGLGRPGCLHGPEILPIFQIAIAKREMAYVKMQHSFERPPKIRKSGNLEIRESGNPEIRKSGNPKINFGNPGIRKSGNPEIRKSGYPEIRINLELAEIHFRYTTTTIILSDYDRIIPEICQTYARNMQEIYQKYTKIMPELCQKYA